MDVRLERIEVTGLDEIAKGLLRILEYGVMQDPEIVERTRIERIVVDGAFIGRPCILVLTQPFQGETEVHIDDRLVGIDLDGPAEDPVGPAGGTT